MALWYRPIYPGTQWFKVLLTGILFNVLGRAFQSLSAWDPEIRKETDTWEEGFTVRLRILPNGSILGLKKKGRRLVRAGTRIEKADLEIGFRNLESAYLLFRPVIGIPQAFAERRIWMSGNTARANSFLRVLTSVMTSVYPGRTLSPLNISLPKPSLRRTGLRIWFYSFGILLAR